MRFSGLLATRWKFEEVRGDRCGSEYSVVKEVNEEVMVGMFK